MLKFSAVNVLNTTKVFGLVFSRERVYTRSNDLKENVYVFSKKY